MTTPRDKRKAKPTPQIRQGGGWVARRGAGGEAERRRHRHGGRRTITTRVSVHVPKQQVSQAAEEKSPQHGHEPRTGIVWKSRSLRGTYLNASNLFVSGPLGSKQQVSDPSCQSTREYEHLWSEDSPTSPTPATAPPPGGMEPRLHRCQNEPNPTHAEVVCSCWSLPPSEHCVLESGANQAPASSPSH